MIDPATALAKLPDGLRLPLLAGYRKIASNYIERRWEPSELNGGKFAEIVYTILQGYLSGTFPATPSKPADMVVACRSLEQTSSVPSRPGDRSVRILIPRMLLGMYEIRNNRGVGHTGGDVNPNHMDATTVYAMASWTMAELVRIFHNLNTEEAQCVVDSLVEYKLPLIWEVGDTRRVLDPKMKKKDQVLVLLYGRTSWTTEEELLNWVEYSNSAMFRKRILAPLHEGRLIEYESLRSRQRISPLGIYYVESNILKTVK